MKLFATLALALALLPALALADPALAPRSYWPKAPLGPGDDLAALALPPPPGGFRFTLAASFNDPVTLGFAPLPDGSLQGRRFQFTPEATRLRLRGAEKLWRCLDTDRIPKGTDCRHLLPPGQKMIDVTDFIVPPAEARTLTKAFAKLRLCKARKEGEIGFDGSTWLFEIQTGTRVCAVMRWTPSAFHDAESRAFVTAGELALQSAGLLGK